MSAVYFGIVFPALFCYSGFLALWLVSPLFVSFMIYVVTSCPFPASVSYSCVWVLSLFSFAPCRPCRTVFGTFDGYNFCQPVKTLFPGLWYHCYIFLLHLDPCCWAHLHQPHGQYRLCDFGLSDQRERKSRDIFVGGSGLMSQCETGSRTAAVGVSQPKIEEGVRRLI